MCLCLRVCVGACAHARVSTYTYVTSYPQNHVDDFESNMFWLKFWKEMVKEHPPIAHEDDCHNEVVATLQSSLFFALDLPYVYILFSSQAFELLHSRMEDGPFAVCLDLLLIRKKTIIFSGAWRNNYVERHLSRDPENVFAST